MIYDKLKNRDAYSTLPARLLRGLEFLATTDFSSLPDGRIPLEGDDIFVNIESYDTHENDKPEAHARYIDIQCVLHGAEMIGVGARDEMREEVSANPEGDIWFYHGPVTDLLLDEGRFLILFPQDVHAPGRKIGSSSNSVRKAVVKVRIE